MSPLQTPLLYQICTQWLALATILLHALSNHPLRLLALHCAHAINTPCRSSLAINPASLIPIPGEVGEKKSRNQEDEH